MRLAIVGPPRVSERPGKLIMTIPRPVTAEEVAAPSEALGRPSLVGDGALVPDANGHALLAEAEMRVAARGGRNKLRKRVASTRRAGILAIIRRIGSVSSTKSEHAVAEQIKPRLSALKT
jgi:hypothetical protein